MTAAELAQSAAETAATFVDEFPGDEPELSWLAEAASIDNVPDDDRDSWFEVVTAWVRLSNYWARAKAERQAFWLRVFSERKDWEAFDYSFNPRTKEILAHYPRSGYSTCALDGTPCQFGGPFQPENPAGNLALDSRESWMAL
jgi:hypothetical protein